MHNGGFLYAFLQRQECFFEKDVDNLEKMWYTITVKSDDEELRRGKTYRERTVGGSVQSVLFQRDPFRAGAPNPLPGVVDALVGPR